MSTGTTTAATTGRSKPESTPELGRRATRGAVALVVLLALLKGVAWSLAIPPWEGPDEPQQFAYVETLAVDGRVPAVADARSARPGVAPEVICSQHAHRFEIYLHDDSLCAAFRNGAGRHLDAPANPAATYFPLYYGVAVPFFDAAGAGGVETRLHAVRSLSIILGGAAAAFTFLSALWAFAGRRDVALAAAAVYTLQPIASQQFAVANNDAMLAALTAAFFWRFFRALRVAPTTWDAVLLAGLCALAYLAKQPGVLLAALLPLPLIVWALRRRLSGRMVAAQAATMVIVIAAAVIVGALGNLAWHATPLPQTGYSAPGDHSAHRYLQGLLDTRFDRIYWLWVASLWGNFDWYHVASPPAVFVAIAIAYAAAAVFFVVALVRRPDARLSLVCAAVAAGGYAAALQALEVYYFRLNGDLILQGRSYLPVLPAAAILLVAGCATLPRRGAHLLSATVAAAAVALNVLSLFVLVDFFYG